jgi:hypothetical protein
MRSIRNAKQVAPSNSPLPSYFAGFPTPFQIGRGIRHPAS